MASEKEMLVPGQLVWEIVRQHNSFVVKQFGKGKSNAKVQFSKEPNNLYNLHAYKFSGLANPKTVSIHPAGARDKDEVAVSIQLTKPKALNTPTRSRRNTLIKRNRVKMANSLNSQVGGSYRPDLTRPALARLSAVYRSLQVAKSGLKKRNRQAHK